MAIYKIAMENAVLTRYLDDKKIVNKSDNDLYEIARHANYSKKEERHRKNKLLLGLSTLPVTVFFSYALTQKAQIGRLLIKKLFAGVNGLVGLAGATALMSGAFCGIYAVSKKSKKLTKFHKNHPMLSTFIDLTIGLGFVDLITAGGKKLTGIFFEKNPQKAKDFKNKINKFKRDLDKSDFNTKTLKNVALSLKEFSKEHGSLAKAGKKAILYAPLISIIGIFLSDSASRAKHENKVASTYKDLKHAQFLAAKDMNKILEINNKKLIEECKREKAVNSDLEAQIEEKAEQKFDKATEKSKED